MRLLFLVILGFLFSSAASATTWHCTPNSGAEFENGKVKTFEKNELSKMVLDIDKQRSLASLVLDNESTPTPQIFDKVAHSVGKDWYHFTDNGTSWAHGVIMSVGLTDQPKTATRYYVNHDANYNFSVTYTCSILK